jgi:hypothetical protein
MKVHQRRETDMRRGLSVLIVSTALTAMAAAPAVAGEVTGTGEPTAGPEHANSICVFSGQNDDPDAPLSLDREIAPNGPGGVAQSFGQNVTLGLSPQDLNPGDACQGGSNTVE